MKDSRASETFFRDWGNWILTPWSRYEGDTAALKGTVEINGETLELWEPRNEEQRREGAAIWDRSRNLTYRATLDPRTNELDYLEACFDGSGNVASRTGQRMVFPVARIESAVQAFVAEHRENAKTGEILAMIDSRNLDNKDADGSMRKPPPSSTIADLMLLGQLNRHEIAARYNRPVRTVDRWMTNARKEFPERFRTPNETPTENGENNE